MSDGYLDERQRRDRQLAAQARYGPRKAAALDGVLGQVMRSPQIRRLQRSCHITAALAEVLAPQTLDRIALQRWSGNTLTLAVQGSPLLAELRQFHQQAMIEALVRHGLGVSRIRLQLQKPRPDGGAA